MSELIGKVEINETGGKNELIVHWNEREEFASLGIGHFIWYPKGVDKNYEESFVKLIQFFEKSQISIPEWLGGTNLECPWNNIEEFRLAKSSNDTKIQELERLLQATKYEQMEVILERANKAIPKILETLDENNQLQLIEIVDLMAKSPGGIYAMVDYINFKGEGVNLLERYKGLGWGLSQVLQNMDIIKASENPVKEFVRSAKEILARRIQNSPEGRKEHKWKQGWYARLDRYLI